MSRLAHFIAPLLLALACAIAHLILQPSSPRAEDIIIDAVVASVGGKPVTLSELGSELAPARKPSLDEVRADPLVRQALDNLILQRLVALDATAKKVGVRDEEVNEYIASVASQNGMTLNQLEEALAREQRSMQQYARRVKTEILKAKIASSHLKSSVAVSTEEIDAYLSEHPELQSEGEKLKLRQILITVKPDGTEGGREQSQALEIVDKARSELAAGRSFAEVARTYSEGPAAQDGGLLGVVSETDLSGPVLVAVSKLKEGDVSDVVISESGAHLFKVDKRFGGKKSDKAIRREIRELLQQQKLQARVAEYFSSELYRMYPVEKKL